MIPLTIVGDIDGSARSENGGNARLIKPSGVLGAVLGLEAEQNALAHVFVGYGRVIYLGAVERRARARGIDDGESVLGEGVQDATGIVEKFEGLVSSVGDSRCDLQVLQPINVDIGGRSLDGQAGGSRDGDRRGDEGDEGTTERRGKHSNEGSEDGERCSSLGLDEPGLNSHPILVHMDETPGQTREGRPRNQIG